MVDCLNVDGTDYLFLSLSRCCKGKSQSVCPAALLRLTSYSWNGPIVLHTAFSPNQWRGDKKNKTDKSFFLWRILTWNPSQTRALWLNSCYATKYHTTRTQTHIQPGADGTTCPQLTQNLWRHETNKPKKIIKIGRLISIWTQMKEKIKREIIP